MSSAGSNILPMYFVADESYSMKDYLHLIDQGIENLKDELQLESLAASKVRFSIAGFSDAVTEYLRLVDFRRVENFPSFQAKGSTSYAAAFSYLYGVIETDVLELKSQGHLVNRPAVFFLSDGLPNPGDVWRPALNSLKDAQNKYRPNILAFGIGSEADPRIINEVATQSEFAFVSGQGSDTGTAIAKFCESLVSSTIKSGQALAKGNAEIKLDKPEGFVMAVDVI